MTKDPYRNSAKLYDLSVGILNTSLKRERRRLVPPAPGRRVLDIGCGTGADLRVYSQGGCEVAGVDLSPAMLRMARRRLGDRADLRMCSGTELSFPDDSFDLVLATYVLHEIPHRDRPVVLREMMRVAKPEGRILLTDYLPGPFRFPVGWLIAMIIYVFERAAGRAHFENGRDFLRRGGLTGLVSRSAMKVAKQKPAGGGAIGFFVLESTSSERQQSKRDSAQLSAGRRMMKDGCTSSGGVRFQVRGHGGDCRENRRGAGPGRSSGRRDARRSGGGPESLPGGDTR